MKHIFFLFWIICAPSLAQQLHFKHITNDEGLSTNFVTSIIQDDKGFMWFGTQDGLNKYDGYNFTIFKHDPTSKNSLSSSEITCLRQIRPNLIVVGTREGINFLNPVTLTFTRLNNVAETNVKINTIAEVGTDKLLIGSDKGVFVLTISTLKIEKLNFPIQDELIITSIEQIQGSYYISTKGKGLWVWNGGKIARINFTKPNQSKIKLEELEAINCLKEHNGNLYIGTNGFSLFKVKRNNYEIEEKIQLTNLTFANLFFITDLVIKNNTLYIGTKNGFVVLNLLNNKKNHYDKDKNEDCNPFKLNDNNINKIFLDKENNCWIGSELGGVNVYFSQSTKFFNNIEDKQDVFKNLSAVFETRKGERIIGGPNVLFSITKNKEFFDYSSVLEKNDAISFFQENDSVFWIGTWGNGLIRYDRNTKQKKVFFSSKFGGTIICLKPDGFGNLFIGTYGDGLFKLNLTTFQFKNFGTNEGLPNLNINTIFKDSKNHVWLGTYDGGLIKLKKFPVNKAEVECIYRNEGEIQNISSNIVFGINEDRSGAIWVATSSGLSKLLANNSFHNFYEKDGLPNTFLYSILKDSLDNFWMSSNYGLIKFNPLVDEKKIVFKNYGIKDGLLNKEYNSGSAFVSEYSGNMYFGGGNGYDVFKPTLIKDNLHTPNSYIVNYKRGGKDIVLDSIIPYKKHLKLNWNENYFQFELAALDYVEPTKNKFKYKLEGYDNDWSEPTNVRYVSYNELPGGEYKFLVESTNNDGVWNETPFEINIVVVPPFWKTKWFYFIMIVIIGLSIYGFIQYRTMAVKKENKVLENKVAERTRELAEKNEDITSSIEYAKRIQEAILPSKELMFTKLNKAFILYQPKDIVSGDFYWFAEKNEFRVLAVVDCTGHGVPGAFMSMIGHNLLHQIVSEKGITDPGNILNHLHKGVQNALRQGRNEINTNDGMDVSLIVINAYTNEIKWAGANRPLITVDTDGQFLKFDGNKYPIGGAQLDTSRNFTTQTIQLKKSAMAYLSSDGYADQFGGEKGKKFMVKRFHDLLTSIHKLQPEEQKLALETSFKLWQQDHEQVDDVLVVGIEI